MSSTEQERYQAYGDISDELMAAACSALDKIEHLTAGEAVSLIQAAIALSDRQRDFMQRGREL